MRTTGAHHSVTFDPLLRVKGPGEKYMQYSWMWVIWAFALLVWKYELEIKREQPKFQLFIFCVCFLCVVEMSPFVPGGLSTDLGVLSNDDDPDCVPKSQTPCAKVCKSSVSDLHSKVWVYVTICVMISVRLSGCIHKLNVRLSSKTTVPSTIKLCMTIITIKLYTSIALFVTF